MAIKIMLADDHAIVRAGLQRLLRDEPDMKIVGEACDGVRAIDLIDACTPDVIIMDVTMPGINGIEATRRIKARHPDIRIVALSALATPHFVQGMVRAGATSYLLKDNLFDELLTAIREAVEGRSYLCPEAASIMVQTYSHEEASGADLDENERELIKLLAQGLSAQAIAEQQGLSVKTVEGRRRRLMKKLNLDAIAQLVQYAIAEGLIDLPSSR